MLHILLSFTCFINAHISGDMRLYRYVLGDNCRSAMASECCRIAMVKIAHISIGCFVVTVYVCSVDELIERVGVLVQRDG